MLLLLPLLYILYTDITWLAELSSTPTTPTPTPTPPPQTAGPTFCKVFWINLDELGSRATHMIDFLHEYKLEGERVPGVRPEEILFQPDLPTVGDK